MGRKHWWRILCISGAWQEIGISVLLPGRMRDARAWADAPELRYAALALPCCCFLHFTTYLPAFSTSFFLLLSGVRHCCARRYGHMVKSMVIGIWRAWCLAVRSSAVERRLAILAVEKKERAARAYFQHACVLDEGLCVYARAVRRVYISAAALTRWCFFSLAYLPCCRRYSSYGLLLRLSTFCWAGYLG